MWPKIAILRQSVHNGHVINLGKQKLTNGRQCNLAYVPFFEVIISDIM